LALMFGARVTSVERLSLAIRRASAQKAAS
jgi:hypothetical protein